MQRCPWCREYGSALPPSDDEAERHRCDNPHCAMGVYSGRILLSLKDWGEDPPTEPPEHGRGA